MGGGAKAHIRFPLPVTAVVDGLEAGFCKVGYLVVVESRCGGLAAQSVVLAPALLVSGFRIVSVFQHVGQCVVSLYRELVAGDVVHTKGQGLVNCGFPGAVAKVGKAEDEVYAQILDSCFAHDLNGLPSLVCRVAAVHPTEQVLIKGLYAHAYPVYSEGLETLHVGNSFQDDVFRVHFHGELSPGAAVAAFRQGEEDFGKGGKGKQRRGASAKVQRGK